jgi:hypothetical protein
MTLELTKLESLELELSKLEHTNNCPVLKSRSLCECGLSEGRRRMYNYIENKRIERKQNEKTNENH